MIEGNKFRRRAKRNDSSSLSLQEPNLDALSTRTMSDSSTSYMQTSLPSKEEDSEQLLSDFLDESSQNLQQQEDMDDDFQEITEDVNQEGKLPVKVQQECQNTQTPSFPISKKKRIYFANIYPRKYLKSAFATMGVVFLLNGLLLYAGSAWQEYTGNQFDVSRYYNIEVNPTSMFMQKTSGILFIMLAMMNLISYSTIENGTLDAVTALFDGMILVHLSFETFYFKSLRLEIVIVMAAFIILNLTWTAKDIIQQSKIMEQSRNQIN